MKKLLLLFFLFLPNISSSQDFNWVKVIDADVSIFIDKSRLKIINKNLRFWVLQNNPVRQNGMFSYQSMIELQEVNCLEDKTKVLKQTMYSQSWGGGTSYELPVEEKWNYNSPNTRFDVTLKFACKLKK